ncbi:MAG: FAD-dependent oxidoreductase [Bacteroidales bacterium]|nr:FAD-dependent oxidoreductase [Bacteroidales bacterium]
MKDLYDVIVVGGGAAGLTAGIYTSRAKLKTLIVNEGVLGGQMSLTNEIANFPGTGDVKGYELSNSMKNQARSFGCTIRSNVKVKSYDIEADIKTINLEDGRSFSGKSVIFAVGGQPRKLNIPGEETFKGTGISYCATCDGDFFTDKEVVVVGGGNSALEEAVSLTKYASKVTVVHQFDHFQAFESAVEEAKSNPKIHFIMETEPRAFVGGENLIHVQLEHLPSGKVYDYPSQGAFVFIGYIPNTASLPKSLNLNKNNEIIVDNAMRTNIPGVFAAGDCIEKRYRQITTAVSDGTIAGLSSIEFINENKHKFEYEKEIVA